MARVALFGSLLVTVFALFACARQPSPVPPAQPIAFSHKLHVTQNQMGCTMCHAYAAHSPVAGIPSMQRCVGCHKFVSPEKPSIVAILAANTAGKPIEWTRVHRLPDHVYFTHERHIGAGLRCQECHGAVEEMDTVHQVNTLAMGWCVNCHRARQAPLECNTCHK